MVFAFSLIAASALWLLPLLLQTDDEYDGFLRPQAVVTEANCSPIDACKALTTETVLERVGHVRESDVTKAIVKTPAGVLVSIHADLVEWRPRPTKTWGRCKLGSCVDCLVIVAVHRIGQGVRVQRISGNWSLVSVDVVGPVDHSRYPHDPEFSIEDAESVNLIVADGSFRKKLRIGGSAAAVTQLLKLHDEGAILTPSPQMSCDRSINKTLH